MYIVSDMANVSCIIHTVTGLYVKNVTNVPIYKILFKMFIITEVTPPV
jgi:hypothetical protein